MNVKGFKIVKVPHVHMKKQHYKRCLLVVIGGMCVAHYVIPDHEHFAALITNLVFFWEPEA